MKVQITEYAGLASDAQGRSVPLGGERLTSYKKTAAGNFPSAFAGRFVRIATDTAIHVKLTGSGAADTDEMIPANSADFFAVTPGQTASFIAA